MSTIRNSPRISPSPSSPFLAPLSIRSMSNLSLNSTVLLPVDFPTVTALSIQFQTHWFPRALGAIHELACMSTNLSPMTFLARLRGCKLVFQAE